MERYKRSNIIKNIICKRNNKGENITVCFFRESLPP